MRLFDRDGHGAEEIVKAVGLIGSQVSFDKWEPLLPLGIRDVVAIIGPEPVAALADHYENPYPDSGLDRPLLLLQQAVAYFTWLKMIPTLDAQHDSAGRGRRLGENEKGLTALEQFKDEENIRRLAYEFTDALVEALDEGEFNFWVMSAKCRQRAGLLIQSKTEFDRYYVIGSHRLFITLLPMIREVQMSDVSPVMGRELLGRVLGGESGLEDIADTAARAVALLTMKKAVERLPVEVLPEGIVQVQQSQPIKQRLRAEKEARQSVAQSLGADAARYIRQLEDLVAALNAEGAPVDRHVAGPIVHSKGMSF